MNRQELMALFNKYPSVMSSLQSRIKGAMFSS